MWLAQLLMNWSGWPGLVARLELAVWPGLARMELEDWPELARMESTTLQHFPRLYNQLLEINARLKVASAYCQRNLSPGVST